MIKKRKAREYPPLIDKTGQRFGMLVAIRPEKTNGNRCGWLCRCDCGREKIIDSSALAVGNSTSCGVCNRKATAQKYNGKNFYKHGQSGTPLHKCWASMVRRVKYDPHYSKKSICIEWLEFAPFAEWASKNGYVAGLTIDRIDNEKGYSPSNCRFATKAEQAQNRTTTKLDWPSVKEIRALALKTCMTHTEIAKRFNIARATVGDIINNRRWVEQPTPDNIVS